MLKKIIKIMAFVVVALLTLVALVVVEENIRGRSAWECHLSELAAKGDTLDILKVAPPPVSEAQNMAAAPIFAELMTATNQDQTRLGKALKKVLPQGLAVGDWRIGQCADLSRLRTAFSNENLLAALEPTSAVLAEIETAAARPQCRFPIQYEKGFECLLPHLVSIRQAARVIQVRALAELAAGQSDASLKDIRLILRLGNAIENEPLLISLLVRISLNNLALQPFWEGLANHRWSNAQLRELQREFAEINFLHQLDCAFHGERCMARWCLEKLLSEPHTILLLGGGDSSCKNKLQAALMRLIPSGWMYFNCLNVDLCYQQRILPCLDSCAGKLYPDRANAVESAFASRDRRIIPYHVLENLLVPAVSSVVVKSGVAQTAVQSGALACALERYRLVNGHYPDRLDKLVPQFTADVPRDVIDGQPLRYRPDGAGYIIFSIGWNQKDDSGQVVFKKQNDPKAKPQLDEKQGDWVWRSCPTP